MNQMNQKLINFSSSCCPTTAKKDLSATPANESSALKDMSNGSSTASEEAKKDGANGSSNTSGHAKKPSEQILNCRKKSELESFLKESKKKQCQLVVLNFTTTWCKPCIAAEKPLKKLAKEFVDVKFAKVDVDHFPDLVKEKEVVKMPTFLLMKRNQSSNNGTENVKEDNNDDGAKARKKCIPDCKRGKESQITHFKVVCRVVGINKEKDLENLKKEIKNYCHTINY